MTQDANISMMQERAGCEGIAIALPRAYTPEQLKAAADELLYQISGHRAAYMYRAYTKR